MDNNKIESIVKQIGYDYHHAESLPFENSDFIKNAYTVITSINKRLFAEIPAQTAAYYYNKDFNYTQRAFYAPVQWIELCKDLTRDYTADSVMNPFENLYYK